MQSWCYNHHQTPSCSSTIQIKSLANNYHKKNKRNTKPSLTWGCKIQSIHHANFVSANSASSSHKNNIDSHTATGVFSQTRTHTLVASLRWILLFTSDGRTDGRREVRVPLCSPRSATLTLWWAYLAGWARDAIYLCVCVCGSARSRCYPLAFPVAFFIYFLFRRNGVLLVFSQEKRSWRSAFWKNVHGRGGFS